jgi:mannose-6-phosphate isomerase-like protein (cupin superfamily)
MVRGELLTRRVILKIVAGAALLLLSSLWVITPAGSPRGTALANGTHGVYVFSDEVAKGDERGGFTVKMMVRQPTYTVGAIAARDIAPHRHPDGDHVLYIVSGRGTMTMGGERVELRPGLIVHVPKTVPHAVKAETGNLLFVDFAQPPFDPSKIEWIR